jgi:hypothetical protein
MVAPLMQAASSILFLQINLFFRVHYIFEPLLLEVSSIFLFFFGNQSLLLFVQTAQKYELFCCRHKESTKISIRFWQYFF